MTNALDWRGHGDVMVDNWVYVEIEFFIVTWKITYWSMSSMPYSGYCSFNKHTLWMYIAMEETREQYIELVIS